MSTPLRKAVLIDVHSRTEDVDTEWLRKTLDVVMLCDGGPPKHFGLYVNQSSLVMVRELVASTPYATQISVFGHANRSVIDMAMALHVGITLPAEKTLVVIISDMADADMGELGVLSSNIERYGSVGVILNPVGDLDKFLETLAESIQSHYRELAVNLDTFDFTGLVSRLEKAEKTMPFVAISWFKNTVMNYSTVGTTDPRQKQKIINRAIELGLVEAYKVDNKNPSGNRVSAIRVVKKPEPV